MKTSFSSPLAPRPSPQPLIPKRMVVIRLDRIGDVVLSTPVLTTLRQRFPHAFIAMMVRPACRGLGIGKALLAEFEKWSLARGAQALVVPCGREGFYEKMGFNKGSILRYWKDLPAKN